MYSSLKETDISDIVVLIITMVLKLFLWSYNPQMTHQDLQERHEVYGGRRQQQKEQFKCLWGVQKLSFFELGKWKKTIVIDSKHFSAKDLPFITGNYSVIPIFHDWQSLPDSYSPFYSTLFWTSQIPGKGS